MTDQMRTDVDVSLLIETGKALLRKGANATIQYEGWLVQCKMRARGGFHGDLYWYSPDGEVLRSAVAITRKLLSQPEALAASKTTETLAVGHQPTVGSRIRLYFSGDEQYYPGVIAAFDQARGVHQINYDDETIQWHRMKDEEWRYEAEGEGIDEEYIMQKSEWPVEGIVGKFTGDPTHKFAGYYLVHWKPSGRSAHLARHPHASPTRPCPRLRAGRAMAGFGSRLGSHRPTLVRIWSKHMRGSTASWNASTDACLQVDQRRA